MGVAEVEVHGFECVLNEPRFVGGVAPRFVALFGAADAGSSEVQFTATAKLSEAEVAQAKACWRGDGCFGRDKVAWFWGFSDGKAKSSETRRWQGAVGGDTGTSVRVLLLMMSQVHLRLSFRSACFIPAFVAFPPSRPALAAGQQGGLCGENGESGQGGLR